MQANENRSIKDTLIWVNIRSYASSLFVR